jgi:hypothetical protein
MRFWRRSANGRIGTLIVFRVGGTDAKILAPEFHPLEQNALADQLPFKAWLRRADYAGQHPTDCGPRMSLSRSRLGTVIAQSRRSFGRNI